MEPTPAQQEGRLRTACLLAVTFILVTVPLVNILAGRPMTG